MSDIQGTVITEFYGSGEYENRRATVAIVGGTFMVLMYERHGDDYTLIEGRSMEEHNENYACDCAENWVIGVIK